MARIFAGCIGFFGAINALAGFFRAGLDANIWWIDLRALPPNLARVLLLCACVCLILYSVNPALSAVRRIVTISAICAIAVACVFNCVVYYRLLARGGIRSSVPIPLSAFIVAILVGILWGVIKQTPEVKAPELNWSVSGLALVICLLGFPLAQIFLFGKTDYSRRADVAVVFGARAYADGSASMALYDRVNTACSLYKRGLVKHLIFSGGPGDGAFHETDVMRKIALRLGVPDADISSDREGLNTRATLSNVRAACAISGPVRILAVSHYYHLPRIKLESERLGIEVFTVPARESYTLTKMPLLILREVAALWKYYLVPPAN